MFNDANVEGTFERNELRFEPIKVLRNTERLVFEIPVRANEPGVVNIVAKLVSNAVTVPVERSQRVEILSD